MSDFEIDLGNGKSIVVDAPDAQTAAKSARMYLARGKGTAEAGRSTSDNMAQAFGSGALGNMGDEATAAVRAATPGLSNWMMRGPALQRDESIGGSPQAQTVSNAPTFEGRYDEELARERAKAKEFQRTDPALAMGSNIAGNVATTALALPAGATAVGPSAMANVAKNVGVGAGIGGISGFGEGEGFDDRLWKAGVGTAIGGGAGALVRPLANVGTSILESGLVRPVADKAQRLAQILQRGPTPPAPTVSPTAEQGAAERIASVFQKDRMTPQVAEQRLAALGPEAIPSDISESLLQKGVNMKTLDGETRQRAKDFFDPFLPKPGEEGRNARAQMRMNTAAEGNAPPPSNFAAQEGMAGHLQGVGKRSYQGDMEAAGFKNSPGISEMIEKNKYVNKAIDEVMAVEKEARAGRPDAIPASPVEIMHKVKQKIWDMGFTGPNAKPGAESSYFRDLGIDFMQKLKAANPEIAKADVAYSAAASLPDFYNAGASVFTKGMGEKATSGSAPAIADLLQGANSAQTATTRAGVVNAVRDTASPLALAQKIGKGVEPGGIQDALRAAMPDEAQALINRSAGERIFANTSNRYMGGPHTADDTIGALGDLSVRGSTHGGLLGRFQESLGTVAKWATNPNEAVRNEIGRMLLSAKPEEQQRMLAMIAQILQQRAAGTPAAAGLAGAVGAQAGRAF